MENCYIFVNTKKYNQNEEKNIFKYKQKINKLLIFEKEKEKLIQFNSWARFFLILLLL